MKELNAITDTWRMIEKFGIAEWTNTDRKTILIKDEDFQKMLDGSVNKMYINNLLAGSGRLYGRGDF
jgi:hypothetical protein